MAGFPPENKGADLRQSAKTATLAIFLLLMAALFIWQGSRIILSEPGDPDPDGYISYAAHINTHGELPQNHRRPPGFPLVVWAVDKLGPGDAVQNIRLFNLLLASLLLVSTSFFVYKYFGPLAMILYGAIFGINSYFLIVATTGLADVFHCVLVYLLLIVALWLVSSATPRRHYWYLAFAVLTAYAAVVHPSSILRALIFFTCLLAVSLILQYTNRARPPAKSPHRYHRERTLALLILITIVIGGFYSRLNRNNSDFYGEWFAYRMLLCLPPPMQATPPDWHVEEAKDIQSQQQGYRVELVTPPARSEILLQATKNLPPNVWRDRLREHPQALIQCVAFELRSKYHTFVKNITPLSPYGNGVGLFTIDVNKENPSLFANLFYWLSYDDKSLITFSYPPDHATPRDTLFWKTGINLFTHTAVNAPESEVTQRFFVELGRITVVVGVTLMGMYLFAMRFRIVGTALPVSMLLYALAMSISLPVETRYFLPYLPYIYLCQAMAILHILRRLINSSKFIRPLNISTQSA